MNFYQYLDKEYVGKIDIEKIELAKDILKVAIKNNIPIYIIGNGGSAFTASHFAQDLVKICNADSQSLSDNIGLVMAIANDISYDEVFKFQLKKKNHEFILICISCSGNSKNVLNAAQYAKNIEMPVISFTGGNGGELSKITDLEINVPSENLFVSEPAHSMIMHYLVHMLEDYGF